MINRQTGLRVGLDFGSTRTRLTYYYEGVYRSLPILPSYVGFDEDTGKLIVGSPAEAKYYQEGTSVAYNLKGAILRDQKFNLGRQSFLAVSLVSELLRTLIIDLETSLGCSVESAVMTVPSFFSELHKGALKDAALLSGLQNVTIISEPTAALLSYKERLLEKDPLFSPKKVLLLDSGGLTTDATLCTLSSERILVQGVHGSNKVGCSRVDKDIAKHISDVLQNEGVIISKDDSRRICSMAEVVKMNYIQGKESTIDFEYDGGVRTYTLDHKVVQDAIMTYVDGIMSVYTKMNHDHPDIDQVLLIGGPFQSEFIKSRLTDHIRQSAGKSTTRVVEYPDNGYTVSKGAAIYANKLASGEKGTLSDVIPLAIGIETGGGYFSPIIPANTVYPSTFNRVFTTTEDDQTKILVHVYQGNRPLVKDCFYLGSLCLKDIAPAPRGIPEIKVSLITTNEGLLSVKAQDLLTGNQKLATLDAQNRLKSPQRRVLMNTLSKYRGAETSLIDKLYLADLARAWRKNLEDYKDHHGHLKEPVALVYERLSTLLRTIPLNYTELESCVHTLDEYMQDSDKGSAYGNLPQEV